ncbi:MAG: hypothetical protein ICV59_00725 [Thermoleophilia bacterium]|nr:hypothetical protein [Thermoleophilia bacterium]
MRSVGSIVVGSKLIVVGSKLLLLCVIGFALVIAGLVLGADRAPGGVQAPTPCAETGVFWKMITNETWAYGARNEISLTNHDLDNCVSFGGHYGTGQTARVLLNGQPGNYVEAGWREWDCTFAGGHCFHAFMYSRVNNVVQGTVYTGNFACLNPGNYHRWQVNNVAGTNNWDGWLDCEDGQGFRYLARKSAHVPSGWAEGEGWRRDDRDPANGTTTMGETHRNLHWKTFIGEWRTAFGVTCRYDSDGGWNGNWVTATRFDIVRAPSGTNC